MDPGAYALYASERDNWLKVGRARLLHTLLRPMLSRDAEVLDLGSGVGQNVPTLATLGSVDALESNPIGLAALRELNCIRRIIPERIPCTLNATYDAIVAMDVIEHINNDEEVAAWIAAHLRPNGILFATVPAYQWLFSGHDVALGHFRRYTVKSFRGLLPPELAISKIGYFNSALFPLAAATRLVLRRPGKQSSQMPGIIDALFRKILSAEIKCISTIGGLPFGLSVYCVAQKRLSST